MPDGDPAFRRGIRRGVPARPGSGTPGAAVRAIRSGQGRRRPRDRTPTHRASGGTAKEKGNRLKRAIVSDIHANLEALEAVLQDAADEGVTEIYCLGDVVGYGPNPCECIDRVMTFQACVLGNHDQGALFDPEGFSSGAERAIFWTRDQLESGPGDPAQRRKRWDFLADLPRTIRENGFTFLHGSPRNPLNEYVFPEDVHNPRKLEKMFCSWNATASRVTRMSPGCLRPRDAFCGRSRSATRTCCVMRRR